MKPDETITLENGYSIRVIYTAQGKVWYAMAYEGELFVCRHYGEKAISLCKGSITRRVNGTVTKREPVLTPANFIEKDEEW